MSPTLLITAGQTSDGTWNLLAIDKRTGERVAAVEIPDATGYGMSSWVREGKQYAIVRSRTSSRSAGSIRPSDLGGVYELLTGMR